MANAMFQAIDNHNCCIESFFEGDAPTTLEGAAQAFAQEFPADYSEWTEQQLRDSWKQQEEEREVLMYAA